MENTYTENQYIWAVCRECPEDGLSITVAYFTSQGKAEKYCNKHRLTRVVQTSLLKSNTGVFYKMPFFQEVLVDAPEKDEILAKLTPAEKKVLGLI